jgi:hypothetical protein
MNKIFFVAYFLCLAAAPLYALDLALIEARVLSLVNSERGTRHLPPVKLFPKLTALAQKHSAEMAARGRLSHAFEGRNALVRIQADYPELFGLVGENVAYQFGNTEREIARKLMQGWMKSPGHRKNILNPQYNYLGVGIVTRGGRYYATQFFAALIAELQTRLPATISYGSQVTMKFDYLGNFPKQDIRVWIEFPDPGEKFYITRQKYYKGRGLYTPIWKGRSFSITFTCNKGKGSYKIFVGKRNKIYPLGIRVSVHDKE